MGLKTVLAAGLIISAFAATPAAAADRSADIHKRVLVLDSHSDVVLPTTPQRYLLPDHQSATAVPLLIAGGVDAIVMTAAAPPASGNREADVPILRQEIDAKLAAIKAIAGANSDRVAIALTVEDVTRLNRQGKIAIIMGFQNALAIGKDISQFNIMYSQGVRIFGFNHAGHNDLSDSSRPINDQPLSENGGLSALGREAVRKLNDLGALIDVSQMSTDALLQTLQTSRAPVVASHSSARALVDNPRNLSDAELDAIKVNGGVVQVTPYGIYVHRLTPEEHATIEDIRARYGLAHEATNIFEGAHLLGLRGYTFTDEVMAALPKATVKDFVDHIDHIAKRIGWRHVGIGSDFNHGSGVAGFESEAEALNVTRELVSRGYTEKQIAAIWGGNFLRALRGAQARRAE